MIGFLISDSRYDENLLIDCSSYDLIEVLSLSVLFFFLDVSFENQSG